MIKHIFKCHCIFCGSECGYEELICGVCSGKLTRIRYRCSNCGHALSVNAKYCRHCADKEYIGRYYSDYFYDAFMKAMIRSVKYGWRWRGAGQLGTFCLAEGLDFSSYDCGVVVPYHFFRRFARFVQPVDIIGGEFARRGLRMEHFLHRSINTAYQSTLTRGKRFKNVKGVFEVSKGLDEMKILLIDDLKTTGATIMECAKVLKNAGAHVVDVYTLISGV